MEREYKEVSFVKAFRDTRQQNHTWDAKTNSMRFDHSSIDDNYSESARKYAWEMFDQVCDDVKRGPDEVIALGYSIPESWPPNLQLACKRWFQGFGADLCYKEPNPHKLRQWYWKRIGQEDQELSREDIQEYLFRDTNSNLTETEAYFVADQILSALENGTMFDGEHGSLAGIDDTYQEEEEQETMRGLYEVFIVNINDTDDIDVTQVVADSDDKAKMKAWSEMVFEPGTTPDVDDYDFFTVKIGGIREGCCKGDSCKT
jgi:hypothetical protein